MRMKLTVLAAVSLMFVGVGCTVTTGSDHTLVSQRAESVPAGYCGSVEGPFNLPSGTVNDYTISDGDGYDVMDVTIADFGLYGCDLAGGYGTQRGVTDISSGTGSVPAGYYDFIVSCRNPVVDCQFFLTWTANY
jgi:hypothetical protein